MVLGRPFVEMAKQREDGYLPKLGINNRTKSRTFVKAQALVTITSLVAQRYGSSKLAGSKRKRGAGQQGEVLGQQEADGGQQHEQRATTAAAAAAAGAGAGAAAEMAVPGRGCKADPASVAAHLAWLTTAEPLAEEDWDHNVAYAGGGGVEAGEGRDA